MDNVEIRENGVHFS